MNAEQLLKEMRGYLDELCALPRGLKLNVRVEPRDGQGDLYKVSIDSVLIRGLGWVDGGEGESTTLQGALVKAWAMFMGNVELKKLFSY